MKFSVDEEYWKGRRVLVTGHTGFKGGWLTFALRQLGAEVAGYALAPETEPNLFDTAGLAQDCKHNLGDIRHAEALEACLTEFRPEFVFHLAAQSLVLTSYAEPYRTMDVNIMGTARLLEALRTTPSVRAAVLVTSDKCYRDDGHGTPHAESDPMGGLDPYSASKGAMEIVVESYRNSFFDGKGTALATARAGNVFGGGDWNPNRLVPEALDCLARKVPLKLRHPRHVRPWQFVLEPLAGYLQLARALDEEPQMASRGWNFGPIADDSIRVETLVTRLGQAWGEPLQLDKPEAAAQPHETESLRLDASDARQKLSWSPALTLDRGLKWSVQWHRAFVSAADTTASVRRVMTDQWQQYLARMS